MTWSSEREAVEIPLVQAWGADRPIIEARINGRGPYLFAVDAAVPGITLSRRFGEIVDLAWRHPTYGPPVTTLEQLHLGDPQGGITLTSVESTIFDSESFGEFEGRPVVGILGASLFERWAVELDLAAGRLRLWRGTPTPPPPGHFEHPLEPLGHNRGWSLTLDLDATETDREDSSPKAVVWQLALGRPVSTVSPQVAEALRLTPSPKPPLQWAAELHLGAEPSPVTLSPLEQQASGTEGQLHHGAFGPRTIMRTLPSGTLQWWQRPTPHAPVGRYPDRLPCDARPRACPTTRLVGSRGERVFVEVQVAEPPAHPRYWWRINLGTADHPVTPLLWAHPQAATPITALIELPRGAFEHLRPLDTPLPVLDVVPVGAPCAGKLCVIWPNQPLWRPQAQD
ncbi:MAG: hypothetical protein ACE366_22355 [Bradymonadia bacterium]